MPRAKKHSSQNEWMREQQLPLESFGVSQAKAKSRRKIATTDENRQPRKPARKNVDDSRGESSIGVKRKVGESHTGPLKKQRLCTKSPRRVDYNDSVVEETDDEAAATNNKRTVLGDITSSRRSDPPTSRVLVKKTLSTKYSPLSVPRRRHDAIPTPRDAKIIDVDVLDDVLSSPSRTTDSHYQNTASSMSPPVLRPLCNHRPAFAMPTPSTTPPPSRSSSMAQPLLKIKKLNLEDSAPADASGCLETGPFDSPPSTAIMIVPGKEIAAYPTPATGRAQRLRAGTLGGQGGQKLFGDTIEGGRPSQAKQLRVPKLPPLQTFYPPTSRSEVPSSQSQHLLPFALSPKKNIRSQDMPASVKCLDDRQVEDLIPSSQIGEGELSITARTRLLAGGWRIEDEALPSRSSPRDHTSALASKACDTRQSLSTGMVGSHPALNDRFGQRSGASISTVKAKLADSVFKESVCGSSFTTVIEEELLSYEHTKSPQRNSSLMLSRKSPHRDAKLTMQSTDYVADSEDDDIAYLNDETIRLGKVSDRGSSVTVPDSEDEREDENVPSAKLASSPSKSQFSLPPGDFDGRLTMTQSSVTEPDDDDYTVGLPVLTERGADDDDVDTENIAYRSRTSQAARTQDTGFSMTQPDSQDELNPITTNIELEFLSANLVSENSRPCPQLKRTQLSDGSSQFGGSLPFDVTEFLGMLEGDGSYPDDFPESWRC